MPIEEIKSIDDNQEVEKGNTSTNKVDYANPSKKIMEENDPLVKQEQTEADDLLPENIIKRRTTLDEKVADMEEWSTKDSYMKLLGTIQTAIEAEDRSTANEWLTKVEKKINASDTKTEKEIPIEENTEKNITKNINNSQKNNEAWLKSLLDDEERMSENEWTTNVKLK